MRILILSQYFWPESFIINDLARTLCEQGHKIVVATGKPNYPSGEVFAGYRSKGVQLDVFAGVIEVIRIPLRARGGGGARNLFLNYLSFVWSGLRWLPWLLRGREFDAIFVFCPSPITAAIPGIPLKWLKGAHLALWLQDLWPQSLEATGHVRSPLVRRIVGTMVRAIYAAADTLLVQSRAFSAPVAEYAPVHKIVYYPNSVSAAAPLDGPAVLPPELVETLETQFCVVFAGNIGTAQSVETIIDAAFLLRDLADAKIVLVGSGSRLDWVVQQVHERGLNNVIVAGRFPPSAMPDIYRRSAGLLVTLTAHEIFSFTIPSKVQAYLAAGRPIIASVNGEGARVVADAGAGLTCAAEDASGLAQCVRALREMPEAERMRLGTNGARYFQEHFEMGRQAHRLIEILEQRMAERNGEH